ERDVCTELELTNLGTATMRSDDGGMLVLVRFPGTSLKSVSVDRVATAQPVFVSGDQILNCSVARANAVKLMLGWWPPGARFKARFEIEQPLKNFEIWYAGILENGSQVEGSEILPMQ